MTASSYGFGEAIRAALTLARTRLVLALGGSASTDGGIGMLAALGYRFLDHAGHLLAPTAENLNRIHRVEDRGAVDLGGIDLIVAGDVTSPLLGLTGAAAVFGPQKGATAAQVAQLDAGLANLVAAFTRSGHTAAETARPRPRLRCRRRHRFHRHAAGRHHRLRRGVLPGPARLRPPRRRRGPGHHRGRTPRSAPDATGQTTPPRSRYAPTPTPVVAVVGRNDLGNDTATPDSPTSSPSPTSPTTTPPTIRTAPQNYCTTRNPDRHRYPASL